MESIIKDILKCASVKKSKFACGGGCISNAAVYQADDQYVFVKTYKDKIAQSMFKGEEVSLTKIGETHTVRVPAPLGVFDTPSGENGIIMEYLELKSLDRKAKLLGDQFARMHLHNLKQEEKAKRDESIVGSSPSGNDESFISKFGFFVPTHCGKIIQENDWCNNWIDFYGRKIDYQISLLEKSGDRTAAELWSQLQRKLPELFKGCIVKPSLLHGDLWSGNVAECGNEPVIFDPSSFYGHHEFDLAIAAMFGGFPQSFWDTYHSIIPRDIGWQRRHELYKLFHYLNHWNHFGGGYKRSSLDIMKSLLKV